VWPFPVPASSVKVTYYDPTAMARRAGRLGGVVAVKVSVPRPPKETRELGVYGASERASRCRMLARLDGSGMPPSK